MSDAPVAATDVVERLHATVTTPDGSYFLPVCAEAAAEIARLREEVRDFRHAAGVANMAVEALRAEVAALRACLAWVDQVYPATTVDGSARVEMTWDEFNAMREAIGLSPRKPTGKRG